uniref:Uncharacterized protein n=1 Tax=Cacopsylla melanoneura TaxID=428564 RepID=A0A8D8PY87_9HEMI
MVVESFVKVWTKLLLLCILGCGMATSSNHRKKRYLHFPDKSSFTMTLTLLRQTAVNFPLLNTLHELDFGFRLPQHPEEIFYKKFKPKHRERRQIHQSISHVTQLLSPAVSQSPCCLSQLVHSPPALIPEEEEDLLAEIVDIVLDSLKAVVPAPTQTDSCSSANISCAVASYRREDIATFLHHHLQLMHSFHAL